jgi:large subunit ribosomal protein L17
MRHGLKGRLFGRTSSHRAAMFSNLAQSLIRFEQIRTTLPKAKDLRPFVEKMITMGKKQDLHARRLLASRLRHDDLAKKVVTTLADRYMSRAGGYIRIIKDGFRYGDNAPMAIIEFVDRDPAAKPSGVPLETTSELGE